VAGDLGNPFCEKVNQFFEDNCRQFDRVIFIPGNHEYFYNEEDMTLFWEKICYKLQWNTRDNSMNLRYLNGVYYENNIWKFRKGLSNMELIDVRLRGLENNHPRLTVLNRDIYDLDLDGGSSVKILGCTLWSQIPEEHATAIENKVVDYQKITHVNKPLTVQTTNMFHMLDKLWLEKKIQELKGLDILVVTHHAPLVTGTCHPKFLGKNGLDRVKHGNYAYSTDLSYLMGGSIRAWIYGHTHWRGVQMNRGTLVTSNALGRIPKDTYQSLRSL